jgi:hypothetical protein
MDIPDTRQRILLRVNKKHEKTIRPSRSGPVDNARIILWDDLSTTIFDRLIISPAGYGSTCPRASATEKSALFTKIFRLRNLNLLNKIFTDEEKPSDPDPTLCLFHSPHFNYMIIRSG